MVKRLLCLVLALAVVVTVCACSSEKPQGEVEEEYKMPDKLENLVADSGFAHSTDGWILDGAVARQAGNSRSATDDYSLKFTGFGYALYKFKDIKPGEYTLRYFLYDQGNVKRAEMAVFVNGVQAALIDYCKRHWWQEFATNSITVPENAEVSIKFTADGENFSLDLDEVCFIKLPENANPEPFNSGNAVSRLVKREDGSYYMQVNGQPFLWQGAHAVSNSDATDDQLVAKVKEAGCTVFSYPLYWNKIQPEATEEYNFSELDAVIALAEKYDIYVDIVWAGAGYCGNSIHTPEYIKNLHSVHAKDNNGKCEQMAIDNEGKQFLCICEYGNEQLIKLESKVISAIMKYLAEKDVNKKVISIQIENEAAESLYNSVSLDYTDLAKHIDALAKVVKESEHSMLVRINQGFGSAPHFVFNTKYIDFNGTDPYTDNIYYIQRTVSDSFNSRIGNLSENGGFDTTTAQLGIAYSNSGYVSIYPVDRDVYWDRPGLYGENFTVLEYTTDITNLNKAVSKMSGKIALAPTDSKASFNTATSGKLSDASDTKKVGKANIRFETMESNGAVGIALVEGNSIYCVADKASYFSVYGTQVKAFICEPDSDGNLKETKEIKAADATDGSFRAEYTEGTVLKLTVESYTEPTEGLKPNDPVIDVSAIDPIDAPIGKNLVSNSSFENGLEEWKTATTGEVNHVSSVGCAPDGGGTHSVNFWNESVARGSTTFSYNVGVVPAGTYDFGFTVRGGNYGDKDFKAVVFANGVELTQKYVKDIDGNSFAEQILSGIELKEKTKIKIAIVLECQIDGAWSYMDLVTFKRTK